MSALIPLSGKLRAPPLAVSRGDNCSAFTTALIVSPFYFSSLEFSVMELEIIFVDPLFSPVDIFSLAAILFVSERNLEIVALENVIHSYGE